MTDAIHPILVVEDNPDDEAMTVRALKTSGVENEIVVVRDGAAALDYLHGSAAAPGNGAGLLPQVVLLDLKLPKLDGLEVLQRIRAHPLTHTLPVVVLTSSDEEQDVVKSYDLGANSYVRKPVAFKDFTEAVRSLGLYWALINKLAPRRT